MSGSLDLEWLLKVRVAVARCGEMDLKKWWNTDGQLGPYGARTLSRGLPRTHHFAQARAVFAVAAHRCSQVFSPPDCATLWHLNDAIEDDFDARWEGWLDDAENWKPFFEEVAAIEPGNLSSILHQLNLISQFEIEEAKGLKRSVGNNSIPLPNDFARNRESVSLLALGFSLCGAADLAVPYARKGNA